MEELIVTNISCTISVESSLRSLSNVNDNIQYSDSNYSALISNEDVTSIVVYSDYTLDKRKYLEYSTTNISASLSSTDVRVFRSLYSCFKGYNTYPLLNRTLRTLINYDFSNNIFYSSIEMMLINTTQIILQDTELYYRLLCSSFISNVLPMTSGNTVPVYSTSLKKLSCSLFKSSSINILTATQSIVYSSDQNNYICLLSNKSGVVALMATTQSLNFIQLKANNYSSLRHRSSELTIPSTSQITIYSSSIKLYKVNDINYTSTVIKSKTNTQNLVYGGDNTFYSLNGFFNYFRYKYPSLMPNLYTVLIGNKLINMYNNSMSCIESHKIGYKKVPVSENFLIDANGIWCSKLSLPLLVYENKVVFFYNSKLFTYDFNNITFSDLNYYAKDYNLAPQNVSLFYDSLYGMPYICCESTEVSQELTEPTEFWNFIQIDNIKELIPQDSIDEQIDYTHELFTPTEYMISGIIARNKDKFILQGYKGATNKAILLADLLFDGQAITELFSYSGSDVLYCSYPYVYYSKLNKEFKSSSIYDSIVKLNLDIMDYTIIELEHLECHIEYNDGVWIVYKDRLTQAYYLVKENELSKKINITANLNLNDDYILEFKIFDTFVYFITSSRKIYELNYYTMQKREVVLTGVPIRLVKFNKTLGCVLSRYSTYLLFETLQPIEWSTNQTEWITPSDLKKGEILQPYGLNNSILFKRSCPIKTIADYTIAERSSLRFIEKEVVVVSNHTKANNLESIAPIRVGICSQLVASEIDMSIINPKTTQMSSMEYSESLKVDKTISRTGELELNIVMPQFPESLAGGYKIYAK